MGQLLKVLSAILVFSAASANAQVESAENFEESFALSAIMHTGSKSGSFVMFNYSRNNEFKCVGGLAAAKNVRTNSVEAHPLSLVFVEIVFRARGIQV